MSNLRLPFGFFVLLAIASSRADDQPAKGPPSLPDDLKRLQGTWEPVKPIEKVGYLQLEFGKAAKDGQDYLAVIHAVDGGGKMLNVGNAVVPFELKEEGKNRIIFPGNKKAGISKIVYRFESDTLIVEEGECNVHHKVSLLGQWKRLKGEKVP